MKKLLILILPIILLALSPFDTPKANKFNLAIFETTKSKENIKAINNKKIKCRYICDKKIYKEQKIAEAISFYKKNR